MDKKEDNNIEDSIDLKTLFRLFLKRKWWFIGTVIIVLAVGMFYVISKPTTYEVRYKFSLRDDYVQDDYLQYSDTQEKYLNNQSVFIGTKDVGLILKTDKILQSLDDLEEIDDYKTEVNTSLINLDLDADKSIFSLKVKNTDKKLAKKIALNLMESLGEQIKISDEKIFDNTMAMIDRDIKTLEDEAIVFEDKIVEIEKEIQDLYSELERQQVSGNVLLNEPHYDILEKKSELLLYQEKIIDNQYQIKKLDDLYQGFLSQKNNVDNRIEVITKDPSYEEENNRLINTVIVILLSLLTGIVVVLVVNYIYKLKQK